jgi:hypothetical protein
MVDSGFAFSHPYFAGKGYNAAVDLAPHAINDATDKSGHGTGESTNLFAVAPGITFVGIKLDNDDDPRKGASLLEGFQQALLHNPQIISISLVSTSGQAIFKAANCPTAWRRWKPKFSRRSRGILLW